MSESEIEAFVDAYRPSTTLSPAFENLFGKIGRAFKKVAKKAVGLAKQGIRFVGKFALGPLLRRLKALVRPLLKRVLRFALGRLPAALQPPARQLAARLGSLSELEEEASGPAGEAMPGVTEIQQEFNEQLANVLFASGEAEQDFEVARVVTESRTPANDALAELDAAREQFIQQLTSLKQDEDPTPQVEQFVPAILPALRLGIRLIGRGRVVGLLASLIGKLIRRFVGPQYTPPLSRAIANSGLRLMNLEVNSEDEARIASSAVGATVEETVRRVSALPDHVLDNQELLESSVLEAFKQAASANLPPVLSEEIYRRRPDLLEARILRGTWLLMPLRGRRKRYKKYSRVAKVRLAPQKLATVRTNGGALVSEVLEEQFGIPPGEEVEAEVHLYEAIPGTNLPELARFEQDASGLSPAGAHAQLHPLTTEAAGLLLGEPGLGREVEPEDLANPYLTRVGRRYYHIRIPGRRPLMASGPGGRPRVRPLTSVRLILDFRTDQVRIFVYLSELRAQGIAVRLRQRTHTGMVVAYLSRVLEQGLMAALVGGYGRLRIIHPAVKPGGWHAALRRLPALVPRILAARLREWSVRGLGDFFKGQGQQFIAAAEDPADGVTLVLTVDTPPAFAPLRQALAGQPMALNDLRLTGGTPAHAAVVRVVSGYYNE